MTITAYSDGQVKDYIAALKDQGYSGDALNAKIVSLAATNSVPVEQLSRVTGYSTNDINAYANSKNTPLQTADQVATKAASDWAATQYGRAPTADELTQVKNIYNYGGLTQDQINAKIDKYTSEAYNYDTQNITSAFRQAYGRNPTDAEFQTAYQNYRNSPITANVVQFNKYTPSVIQDYLNQQIAANPDNKDAAYKNTINTALQKGVTVDELAAATGFSNQQIQDYATANNLGNLDTYAAERAANPTKSFMQLSTLAADPWAGRYATTNPYSVPDNATNSVTLPNGNQIQFTRNVFDALDTMGKSADLRYSDVLAAINMAKANGTMTSAQAADLTSQLASTKTPQEGLAVLSQPQAFVVVDQLYGMQIGQAKNLTDAQNMANNVAPLLNKAAADLGPQYAGIAPSQFTVGQLASDSGVVNYPYSKDAVSQIYANYNSQVPPNAAIDPNAVPGAPNSWQSQIINPIYKQVSDLVDKNYNPYALPTQQNLPDDATILNNPFQRGLDYITRTGNRLANANSPAMQTPTSATVGGTSGPPPTFGLANAFVPNNGLPMTPLPYGPAGNNTFQPTNLQPPGVGSYGGYPTNGLIGSQGAAGFLPYVIPGQTPIYNTPYGPSTTPPPQVATTAPSGGASGSSGSSASTGKAKGGLIKKIKVPSGREHLMKQFKNGEISLKELSSKLKT